MRASQWLFVVGCATLAATMLGSPASDAAEGQPPPIVLSGTVHRASGDPESDPAEVTAYREQSLFESARMALALSPPRAEAKAHLDEHGRFELALQRPGLYRVAVAVRPFGVFVLPGQLALESRELEPLVLPQDATPPHSEPADQQPWRRSNNPQARWTDFDRARPATTLPVHQTRVLTQAGLPAPGVILVDAGSRSPVGKTDETGAAKTPSAARLLVLDEAGGVQTHTPKGVADDSLILQPGVQLRGEVNDSLTGKPIPNAVLWTASDPGRAVFTGSGGQYSLLVPRRELETLYVAAAEHVITAALLHPLEMGAVAKFNVELGRSVSLSGFVLDSSGKGIPRASISAGGPPGIDPLARPQPADRVASGIGGQFGLSSLAPTRKYQLTVEAQGYLPTTATAVSPQVGKSFAPLRITLAPSASAKGRVVDGNGKAVEGVEVLLRPSRDLGATSRRFEKAAPPRPTRRELKFLTATTSAGTFRIPSIPASRFDVIATKAGYSPAVVHGVVAATGVREVSVPEIKLRPGASLAGTIIDPDGKPIRGAVIHLVAELGRLDTLEQRLATSEPDAVSDGKGTFKIADLPAASTYNVLAGAAGFLPKGVRGIRPGGPVVPIQLQRAAQLTGRIVDEQGQPIAGTHIEIDSRRSLPDLPQLEIGETTSRHVTSGADGVFTIRGAPEGRATLVATHRGYVPSESIDVEIPQPDDSSITITLSKGATLAGKITSSAGHAIEGASILVASATRASSLKDGSYEVSGVPLGDVTVEVTDSCCNSATRDVVVGAGRNIVDVELESGAKVAGAAFDANGKPVPAAAIRLLPSQRGRGFRVYDTYTDADGRFEFASVPAGDYRLLAAKDGFASSEAPDLVAVGGVDISDLRLVMQPSGTIEGNLLGLGADDLARVQVRATRSSGGAGLVGQVTSDSRFLVAGLGEGDWVVSAAIDDGREARARVTLAPGETTTQDLQFSGLSLTGTVSYRGESLAGANVSIRGSQFSSRRSATTDWQGNFAIRNLRQDTYWLGVSSRDALVVHNETIALESDADIAIDIDATTVRGRVTDSTTDAPIASAYASVRPREGPDFMIGAGTEADGQFALPQVPSGDYTLFVQADGYSDARTAISVSDQAALDTVQVSLDPVPGLAFRVAIAGRAAPTLIFLSASPANGGGARVTQMITPDSSGISRATRLSAGRWTLAIGAPGAALQELEATIPHSAAYQVVLSPAGEVQIRVPALVSSDEIASVRLVSHTGALLRSFGEGLVLEGSWPLEGGVAKVNGVPFGTWKVVVTTSDGMTKHGSVEVTSSGPTLVTLP